MLRTSSSRPVLSLALALSLSASISRAQLLPSASPPASIAAPSVQSPRRADTALAEALAANPLTAPYRLSVFEQGRKVVLAGRVGDSYAHDAAVRTAIAMGIPISDQIVIDTAAGYAAAQAGGPWTAPQGSLLNSYTYPPPLFGRYDDPFFGLEPPLVTHAPWFGAMSNLRLAQNQPITPPPGQALAADPYAGLGLPLNTIEVAIDPRGVATLRGIVPTEAARLEIGQRLSRMPGIAHVENRLTIGPLAAIIDPSPKRPDDVPPPPPMPSLAQPRPDTNEPAGPAIRPGNDPAPPARPVIPAERRAPANGILGRVDRAIKDRPELTRQPVKVSVHDGVASLSGSVPSVYEAMLAFRAVQQTPGVNAVIDTLQFVVPDGSSPNPLLAKAKTEDIEPYLEAQIRRQVGDSAHLDRVRLEGEQLVITGTLEDADARPRVEAILRSMPILRGFKILPEFRSLQR
jgi:hypothetical protein